MTVAIALAKNKFKKKKLKIIGVEKPTIHGNQIISKINNGIFPFKSNDLKLYNINPTPIEDIVPKYINNYNYDSFYSDS